MCRRTSVAFCRLFLLAVLGCASSLNAQTQLAQTQPAQTQPAAAIETARHYRTTHEVEIVRAYFELLSIPNVASDAVNIRRNAEFLQGELTRRGVEAQLWTLDDAPEAPPIVYGVLDVPGVDRRLGLYVHYDGQPVDEAEWTAPPWTPTLFDGSLEDGAEPIELPAEGPLDPEWRIYARSAGDDKVPFPALFAALAAFAEAGIQPTSDLVFLFEGEEEAGSPHLERYLSAHRDELEADAWLISDGPVHQSRNPQLVFGVRGYTGLDLTVYGATRYLHSGHYGNWAPNPGMRLARLLASMTDDSGDVVIEGFYDSTVPLTDADRAALVSVEAAAPGIDDSLRRELGLAATDGDGAPLMERLLQPSFNVRGMKSAAVGDAARNVIPTRATASIDIRLVAGNDPEAMLDLVEEHIRSQGFHIVRDDPDEATRLKHPKIARVDRRGGYRAARSDAGTPILQDVVRAADAASDDPLILVPSLGGSLPLYLFVDLLEAPLIIVPIANHDDNQHAPDENLRLANLWYGVDLMAAIFSMN